jgi:hypothetical protein
LECGRAGGVAGTHDWITADRSALAGRRAATIDRLRHPQVSNGDLSRGRLGFGLRRRDPFLRLSYDLRRLALVRECGLHHEHKS